MKISSSKMQAYQEVSCFGLSSSDHVPANFFFKLILPSQLLNAI